MELCKKKVARNCSKHIDVSAVVFCRNCNKFFCQECENTHIELLGNSHSVIPVSSVTDFCLRGGKCSVHTEYPLDSLCKSCIGIT